MTPNFQFDIKNIKNISSPEKKMRQESLKLFNNVGFPNKRSEEWKFTDLNKIISENFKKLAPINALANKKNIKLIKNFEHNYIILINGMLSENNFKHEEKNKINISDYKSESIQIKDSKNPLINLNNALSQGGYFLEVSENYKLKKPLIVYNFFTEDLKNQIINNKNLIILNNKCEINIIEINFDDSRDNFIFNNCTDISIGENSLLKNYSIQGCNSKGLFYKFIKGNLKKNSKYEDYIFTSGLKFNKIEEEINIDGEEGSCTIQSALFLEKDSHQEIKTLINHLKPNCKSYQKIKNVLNENCIGAYQGKIFVKDIAQKTDAYQLSKALLLKDTSEFNAKPELEIYADDVKCSHGSTSGSMNEDSIYYLMTRGLSRKSAIELLTKAFLLEIVNSISNIDIKKFIEENLDRQIYGY
jgi:Fe-S cluster assembly protein SufD